MKLTLGKNSNTPRPEFLVYEAHPNGFGENIALFWDEQKAKDYVNMVNRLNPNHDQPPTHHQSRD